MKNVSLKKKNKKFQQYCWPRFKANIDVVLSDEDIKVTHASTNVRLVD